MDWFVSFAADQYMHMGVHELVVDEAPKTANCAAVADVHLKYDFLTKKWQAAFVAGVGGYNVG